MSAQPFTSDNEHEREPIIAPTPAPVSEQTVNPFVCNVCKRSYTRLDHLARHYRSHTREKPFSCVSCRKSFSRADLLKRHSLSHSNHDSEQDPGALRRKGDWASQSSSRVAQACVSCASSKMKCGDEKPCRRCRNKGIECAFPPSQKSAYGSVNSAIPETAAETLDPVNQVQFSDPLPEGSQSLFYNQQDQHRQQHVSPHSADEQVAGAASNQNFSNVILPQNQSIQQYPDMNDLVSVSHPQGPSDLHDDQRMMDFDDSSLAQFLRDIMMPNPAQAAVEDSPIEYDSNPYPSRDVFDFGLDTSLDFTEIDLDWMMAYDPQAPLSNANGYAMDGNQVLMRGQQTPDIRNGFNLGVQAFQNSLWRWAPAHGDHGYAEQGNLSLPSSDMEVLEMSLIGDNLEQRLERASRDQILAMLLGTCQPSAVSKIVSSFPSSQTLNYLMHQFFKSQLSQTESWIHVPTFRPSIQRPELNGMIVAAGAVLSSAPAVRKLGYAMEEAVRLVLPKTFESDNSLTRDLQLLQAYAMQLNTAFWSGNKRKMEIAESFAQPLITMLRRAGRYRRERVSPPAPKREDNDEVLQTKWHRWVKSESFKRLAFYTLIHDAQTSVALLVRPLISYAEVSLELPCSQALWLAKDFHTWREIYLRNFPGPDTRLPSLMHCVHDMRPLEMVQYCTDLHMSTSIILHAIWSLIAEYRQLEHVMKLQQSSGQHGNGGLISTSWHQELCQLLTHFRLTISEWDGGMRPEVVMIQELFMMNLHVSFEDLQLFAGKEGNEEAQRVYPLLRIWKDNRKSRQAIWHAGQVIRAATGCHPSRFRGLCAIALYHASLAFWTYGLVTLGSSRSDNQSSLSSQTAADNELIWLDGEETAETRRFIAIQRGVPVIHDFAGGGNSSSFIRLSNPKAVMDSVINILSKKTRGDGETLPPLAENLGQLMRDLGNAAWVIGAN